MRARALAWRLLPTLAMKIAIAHWQGRVSPVFDVSDSLIVIDILNGVEVHRQHVNLAGRDSFERATEVSRSGAQVLICGALSRPLETALIGAGIQVFGFTCGELESVIGAFQDGQLSDARYLMPGCCARRQRVRLRRRRENDNKQLSQRTRGSDS
jgi:predicted Fe-Mo cluster-binding NifX family protein